MVSFHRPISGEKMIETDARVRQAARLLAKAQKLVILTGAGVSKESGIPTFRDAQEGLWANYDPQVLASPQGFMRDPALVWRWYDMRRSKLIDVKPNPGHYAFALLEELIPNTVLITQNVDGLHALAGSKKIIELHGNINRFFCFENKHEAFEVPSGLSEPPKCHCSSLLRPGVVWFGEALNQTDLSEAFTAAANCDLMIVAGTSGLVQPAASLPFEALRNGAAVIEVNPDETPLSSNADLFIDQPSGIALPLILRELENERQHD
jgi:NAD-dependent deacetylase